METLRYFSKWRQCHFTTLLPFLSSLHMCTSYNSVRCYYYPYSDDFVPEGEQTSAFESSSLPSKRAYILKSYAFSPLFAARTPCCVLGFNMHAKALLLLKPAIRSTIVQILECSVNDVQLGCIRQMKEMLLHRSNTDESPRFADDTYSGIRLHDNGECVQTRYARLPVQARSLIEVYLESEETSSVYNRNDLPQDTIISYGTELQALHYAASLASQRTNVSSTSSSKQIIKLSLAKEINEEVSAPTAMNCMNKEQSIEQSSIDSVEHNMAITRDEKWTTPRQRNDKNIETLDKRTTVIRSRAMQGVVKLQALGVVYCEVPRVDESGFMFDQFLGEEVDESNTEAILRSWERASQNAEEYSKEDYFAEINTKLFVSL